MRKANMTQNPEGVIRKIRKSPFLKERQDGPEGTPVRKQPCTAGYARSSPALEVKPVR